MGQSIVSPCVGLCSTALGDPVCRGCQRTEGEICDWFGYADEQRRERMIELDRLRERIAGDFLEVQDAALLQDQLVRYRVRFRDDQPPLSRAIELLRVGRTRIRDLSRYGLRPKGKGLRLSADELHEAITRVLLERAESRRLALELD